MIILIIFRSGAADLWLLSVPAAMLLQTPFCPVLAVSLKTPIRLIGPIVKIVIFRGVVFKITMQVFIKCRA